MAGLAEGGTPAAAALDAGETGVESAAGAARTAGLGLTVTPTSEEVDVKAVLSKVQLGEVDAGIVYVTDVKAAKDTVVGVPIPADQNVTTDYPIAAISSSANASTAAASPWAWYRSYSISRARLLLA